MRIDLTDICKKPGIERSFPVTSEVDFVNTPESYPIKQLVPFDLSIANMAGKRLSVKGETQTTVIMRCDRCLKDVERTLSLTIDRTYPIQDESIVPDEEDPVSGITDNVLSPDELLQDEIFLSLPSKVLCREDCKGLCPLCGADLNEGACRCERPAGSLQMAKALEGIVL
ncbi:MAG: DUF177 domain-containing protein [Lachnospiraceae bacterium]|nr:DUF177 domain-containing protein [Lachnospiraceae bacterium]